MKYCIFLFFASVTLFSVQAQSHKKGEVYLYWGWNRSAYTNSDIHFSGEDYAFTLYDVIAKDRQSPFSFKTYFKPSSITIPQYNFRIGYFLNENYDISIGADHMKYVMKNYQEVRISGEIQNSGTPFDGIYSNDTTINLVPEFLLFEHTDGLNYENIEIRRTDYLYKSEKFRIESRFGAGIGILVPRTNTTLLNNERYDEFHLAGYGLGAIAGIHFSFFKYFFLQFEGKAGMIHMPDIRTTMSKNDRASQAFLFGQYNGVFGFSYPLFSK